MEERRQGRLQQGWRSHGNVAVARISCVSVRKICARVEPQQHFEEAFRSGIANVAVARVSCILRVSAAGEAATDYF